MTLKVELTEHAYNNIMAVDAINLGRMPYKGIIMSAINAIKRGEVQEPCEDCISRKEAIKCYVGVNWQYCRNLNDINEAIANHDKDWEGLNDANDIISITYDSNHSSFVVFWKLLTESEDKE